MHAHIGSCVRIIIFRTASGSLIYGCMMIFEEFPLYLLGCLIRKSSSSWLCWYNVILVLINSITPACHKGPKSLGLVPNCTCIFWSQLPGIIWKSYANTKSITSVHVTSLLFQTSTCTSKVSSNLHHLVISTH